MTRDAKAGLITFCLGAVLALIGGMARADAEPSYGLESTGAGAAGALLPLGGLLVIAGLFLLVRGFAER